METLYHIISMFTSNETLCENERRLKTMHSTLVTFPSYSDEKEKAGISYGQ